MADNRTTSLGEERWETVCTQTIPGDAIYTRPCLGQPLLLLAVLHRVFVIITS